MDLYNEFLRIAKTLNQKLNITPVLYGSLGLEKVTKVDFSPKDIDILVPLVYLREKWDELKELLEQSGYTLVDLHEHEFIKGDIKIGIAFIEDLCDFAEVDYENLQVIENGGARYHLLTVSDYLKVYKRSAKDGYRRTKNNNKDQDKLRILNERVKL